MLQPNASVVPMAVTVLWVAMKLVEILWFLAKWQAPRWPVYLAIMYRNNLMEALTKVANYQVFGKTLKLLDRHGNLLIQFSSPVQPR